MRLTLPVLPWTPDDGPVSGDGASVVHGLVASRSGAAPLGVWAEGDVNPGVIPAGTITGAWSDSPGGLTTLPGNLYAGANKVHVFVPSVIGRWVGTDITRASGGDYTVGDEGWFFVRFGQHIICTCGKGEPVQLRLDGTATNLTDLITSADKPQAKFIAVVGNRLGLANISYFGASTAPSGVPLDQTVWMSANDNARVFGRGESTHAGDRTQFFPILDGDGEITAYIGGAEVAVLMKRNAILEQRYRNVGTSFRLVDESIGTIYPQSLVWAEGDLYFMSTNKGPCRFSPGSRPVILADAVRRTLQTDDQPDVSPSFRAAEDTTYRACYDPIYGVVHWVYSTDSGTIALLSHGIFGGSFTYSIIGTVWDGSATEAITEVHPIRVDKSGAVNAKRPGQLGLLCLAGGTYGIKEPRGIKVSPDPDSHIINEPAFWASKDIGDERKQSIVRWVRPILAPQTLGSPPKVDVTIRSRMRTDEAYFTTPAATTITWEEMEASGDGELFGRFENPDCTPGMLHRIEITFRQDTLAEAPHATLALFSAVEVELETV